MALPNGDMIHRTNMNQQSAIVMGIEREHSGDISCKFLIVAEDIMSLLISWEYTVYPVGGWDDSSQYMENKRCSKPPTIYNSSYFSMSRLT